MESKISSAEEKGLTQGLEKGLAQGIKQGIEKDVEQGVEQEKINTFIQVFDAAGTNAELYLFGSRAQDSLRGGG